MTSAVNYVGWTRAFAYNRHPYYVVLSYGTPALYVTEPLQWVLPYSSISPTYLEKGGCHRDLPDPPRPEHVDLFPSVPFFRRRNRWKRIASRESRRPFPALLAIIISHNWPMFFKMSVNSNSWLGKYCFFSRASKTDFHMEGITRTCFANEVENDPFLSSLLSFFFFLTGNDSVLDVLGNMTCLLFGGSMWQLPLGFL